MILFQLIIFTLIFKLLDASEIRIDEKSIEDGYKSQLGTGPEIQQSQQQQQIYPEKQPAQLVDNVTPSEIKDLLKKDEIGIQQSSTILPEKPPLIHQSSENKDQIQKDEHLPTSNTTTSKSNNPSPPPATNNGFFSQFTKGLSMPKLETVAKVGLAIGGAAILKNIADERRERIHDLGYGVSPNAFINQPNQGLPYASIHQTIPSIPVAPIYRPIQHPIINLPNQQIRPSMPSIPSNQIQYSPPNPIQNIPYNPIHSPIQNIPYTPLQNHPQQSFRNMQVYNSIPYNPNPSPFYPQLRPFEDKNQVMKYIQDAVSAQMASQYYPHFNVAYSRCHPNNHHIKRCKYLNELSPRRSHHEEAHRFKSTDQVLKEINDRNGSFSFPQFFLNSLDEEELPPPKGFKSNF